MTDAEIFNLLFSGGKISLPYLLKFSHETAGEVLLVNNNEDIRYNGELYEAASFDYIPPSLDGSGASLNITSLPNDNTLFEFLENADSKYRLDVVGTIAAGGVQAIKAYTHFYGSFDMAENGGINFELGNDDRLGMMFPPYKFDTENNAGNA